MQSLSARCIITASDDVIPFSSLCSMITRLLSRVRSLLSVLLAPPPPHHDSSPEREGERGRDETREERRGEYRPTTDGRRTAAKEAGEAAPHAIVKTLSLPPSRSLSVAVAFFLFSFLLPPKTRLPPGAGPALQQPAPSSPSVRRRSVAASIAVQSRLRRRRRSLCSFSLTTLHSRTRSKHRQRRRRR